MISDYCGAGARLSPELGLSLPSSKWAWQPKIDGVYCRVATDRVGRVADVRSRSGREVADARELFGILAGPPDAILHGELDAHTEAGNRAADARGWRNLHLFDCTRSHGVSIAARPYAERWGELHRAHTLLELAGLARLPQLVDRAGRSVRGDAPHDLRRFPIVPLARGATAGRDLWSSHVERGGGEGVVAVRLDAPRGAHGGKRKIKLTDTTTCRVVSFDDSAVVLESGGRAFAVGRSKVRIFPGALVDVQHDGRYESSAAPRFARIVRLRLDLLGDASYTESAGSRLH